MSGTPRHLSSHIRTHRLRSDRSKVSFSGIPSLPIILLDNVSGSHRRLSYDTLGWDGELDRMTTSPSDIVGTGFGLISHPYSPFTSVPNLGTSLATRRRSLLYFYQLRRPSLISISFYFSLFGIIWVSQSLSSSSLERITTIFSFTTRPSPTLTLDLGYRNGFRLSSRRTHPGRKGRSGYPYTHIITSARSHPRFIGPGSCPGDIAGSPMDPPATGRWRSAILLLLLGGFLSLCLSFWVLWDLDLRSDVLSVYSKSSIS
jgi:hypothetical protein